jgi:hypothetical protein
MKPKEDIIAYSSNNLEKLSNLINFLRHFRELNEVAIINYIKDLKKYGNYFEMFFELTPIDSLNDSPLVFVNFNKEFRNRIEPWGEVERRLNRLLIIEKRKTIAQKLLTSDN